MSTFNGFEKSDFEAFADGNQQEIDSACEKLGSLAQILADKLKSEVKVTCEVDRCVASIDEYFRLQMNSEDLSLEWQIKNGEVSKFFAKVNPQSLNELSSLGDSEIVLWDGNKKVCKFYPDYIDRSNIIFLLSKLNAIKRPIFKIRKIYSRSETKELLESTKLIEDLISSIKMLQKRLKG